ncbi:MAG: pyridoxal phosphate-dependent aminotransferase [Eubacteriales bacterium]
MKFSQRVLGITPSATLTVATKAKELKLQGKNVISFGSGEPDFASPKAARKYAQEAIERGETHYTPTPGIRELREQICIYYKERFGLIYEPDQIVTGSGAKPCIYEVLASIVDPGDEVILLAPTWVSYIEQIKLTGGKAAVVDTTNTDFVPCIKEIENKINEKTVAILLNSPSNPTGVMYDEDTIKGFGQLAIKYDLWIIWDEIYEQLVYGEAKHINPVQLMPELASRTIIINGVSKAYAMTGWRIGYSIASKEMSTKLNAMQGHFTSNPCSIAQWAALGVMKESGEDVIKMRQAFSDRRSLITSLLSEMPHISFPHPQGAFYVFVNIKKCIGKQYNGEIIKDDIAFCRLLLEAELVAVVPGNAFLAPGYLRVSYANSPEEIIEGMIRLKRFLRKLE